MPWRKRIASLDSRSKDLASTHGSRSLPTELWEQPQTIRFLIKHLVLVVA